MIFIVHFGLFYISKFPAIEIYCFRTRKKVDFMSLSRAPLFSGFHREGATASRL